MTAALATRARRDVLDLFMDKPPGSRFLTGVREADPF